MLMLAENVVQLDPSDVKELAGWMWACTAVVSGLLGWIKYAQWKTDRRIRLLARAVMTIADKAKINGLSAMIAEGVLNGSHDGGEAD